MSLLIFAVSVACKLVALIFSHCALHVRVVCICFVHYRAQVRHEAQALSLCKRMLNYHFIYFYLCVNYLLVFI